jgi:hypothetical protein
MIEPSWTRLSRRPRCVDRSRAFWHCLIIDIAPCKDVEAVDPPVRKLGRRANFGKFQKLGRIGAEKFYTAGDDVWERRSLLSTINFFIDVTRSVGMARHRHMSPPTVNSLHKNRTFKPLLIKPMESHSDAEIFRFMGAPTLAELAVDAHCGDHIARLPHGRSDKKKQPNSALTPTMTEAATNVNLAMPPHQLRKSKGRIRPLLRGIAETGRSTLGRPARHNSANLPLDRAKHTPSTTFSDDRKSSGQNQGANLHLDHAPPSRSEVER